MHPKMEPGTSQNDTQMGPRGVWDVSRGGRWPKSANVAIHCSHIGRPGSPVGRPGSVNGPSEGDLWNPAGRLLEVNALRFYSDSCSPPLPKGKTKLSFPLSLRLCPSARLYVFFRVGAISAVLSFARVSFLLFVQKVSPNGPRSGPKMRSGWSGRSQKSGW